MHWTKGTMIFNVCFLAKSQSIAWCDLVNTSVNAFLSAYLHLFLRPKSAVLTAFLVKLFRFWSHIICPPPPPHNSFLRGFLTARNWYLLCAGNLKSRQWLCSEILHWVHLSDIIPIPIGRTSYDCYYLQNLLMILSSKEKKVVLNSKPVNKVMPIPTAFRFLSPYLALKWQKQQQRKDQHFLCLI